MSVGLAYPHVPTISSSLSEGDDAGIPKSLRVARPADEAERFGAGRRGLTAEGRVDPRVVDKIELSTQVLRHLFFDGCGCAGSADD